MAAPRAGESCSPGSALRKILLCAAAVPSSLGKELIPETVLGEPVASSPLDEMTLVGDGLLGQ